MSIGTCIYFILLKPLELLFEGIYISANNLIHNPGLSIIILSLSMNILVFPLYRRADMMQEQQRKKEKSMESWVNHIKKTFKGDERFMMLQAYYRQSDYSPFSSVRGALPLLLEIPFFLSAYHFLSNLSLLNGTSFWIIKDLGKPDALITIGGISINVLPIIMTIVNLISSSIYTKDALLKDKLQLYAIAIVFLVFLYPSPAGLTFYWTLNNVFSLIKNIVYHPKDVVESEGEKKNGRGLFAASAILMTVLTGLLIPAALINSSVGEFVDVYFYENPLKYLLATLCLSIGTFIVWAGVLYYLLSDKWKRYLSYLFWIGAVIFIVDYMFFGNSKGILSSNLTYENKLTFWAWEYILNILVIAVIVFFGQLLVRKKGKIASSIAMVLTLALAVMGVSNIFRINKEYKSYAKIAADLKEEAEINLSKNGRNVVVLMMDKAASIYLPYMLSERPELKEKFDGFTYYPNTISFGTSTNTGSPGLYGGYDYIPDEMNKRSDLTLCEKQNEALKVMPVLFSDAGFDVTVCDPTYAGYSWIPDLGIYDDYPEIKSYITKGRFVDNAEDGHKSKVNLLNRNMFCYSLMRVMPVPFRLFIYNDGKYNSGTNYEEEISSQHIDGLSKAEGIDKEFMDTYSVLEKLKDITKIKDDSSDNFLMMSNDTTHTPVLLKEPEYVPEKIIDNSEFDKENMVKSDDEGNTYELDSEKKITHYQVNMAALLRLGDWFDYLRENGVYDNTRIIIVSDHSHKFGQKGMQLDVDGKETDVTGFQCMMLVKDFDTTGFETNDEFMTNADTPSIALNSIIKDPVNPFTGNKINSDVKNNSELHLNYTSNWVIDDNNGNTFLPDDWYTVHDNIFDSSNWKYLGEY